MLIPEARLHLPFLLKLCTSEDVTITMNVVIIIYLIATNRMKSTKVQTLAQFD